MAQPAGSMEGVPKDIGNKMRSAIKAKLTELGCYVDDELPDYVMVMVANKRTRSQMEEDLQLFLGGNTELFVSWLHQVLRRLQEVSVKTAPKPVEPDEPKASKPKSSSKKAKDKKDKKVPKEKHKKSDGSIKKSKKETRKKDKESRKKVQKKSKKKSKNDGIIRPNVPPLLMNLEKESEPSITDVFAGQILKNHGITLEQSNSANTEALIEDLKPIRKALKRTKFPIIDPATVTNVTDPQSTEEVPAETISADIEEISEDTPNPLVIQDNEVLVPKPVINIDATDIQNLPREDQIREMNEIEAKIQGLKKKLVDQLDSMSEDEDFLNIRTEAEELMNDFAEDVLQEISAAQSSTTHTPPLRARHERAARPETMPPAVAVAAPVTVAPAAEQLPLIELQLPKRPMRDRLGARPEPARVDKRQPSNERLTPEKEPPAEDRAKSIRSRLGDSVERERRKRHVDLPERTRDEPASKRVLSRVSATRRSEERARAAPASVVRVRPRPRPAPGAAPPPALLMRAVADAHKSLLNVAPKPDNEPQVKRALVLPMRRAVESQNIVIQVQRERVVSRDTSDCEIDLDTESLTELAADDNYKPSGEYMPEPLKRTVNNQRVHYVPSHTSDSSVVDEDVIKIHNPTVGKERGPQFVVTLDGLDPNVFLAKKLKTEGIADEITARVIKTDLKIEVPIVKPVLGPATEAQVSIEESDVAPPIEKSPRKKTGDSHSNVTVKTEDSPKKRKATQDEWKSQPSPKRKSTEASETVELMGQNESSPKKRCVSPIVFDVDRRQREKQEKEKEKEKDKEKRERKESVGSDITVTTTTSSKKYDSLPSLPPEKRRLPCRAFPACRYGAACAFSHPRCKFAAACSRRDCAYSHPPSASTAAATTLPPAAPPPAIASHVVPVGNYKTTAAVCRYYPACANAACPYVHPKPCRYGRACLNRLQCNFYHADAARWRSPFQV